MSRTPESRPDLGAPPEGRAPIGRSKPSRASEPLYDRILAGMSPADAAAFAASPCVRPLIGLMPSYIYPVPCNACLGCKRE